VYILKKSFLRFIFSYFFLVCFAHADQDWFPAGTEAMHKYGYKGQDQKALVIESEFDLNHPVMKNKFKDCDMAPDSKRKARYGSKISEDHGTMVSSIIHQQAPEAKIIPLEHGFFRKKILDKGRFVSAMLDIFQHNFDAINVSWHPNESMDSPEFMDLYINKLMNFFEWASNMQVPVFVAAGNDQEEYDEDIAPYSDKYSKFRYRLLKLSNKPQHMGKITIVGSSERALEDTWQGKVITERLACSSAQCVTSKSFITFPGKNVPVYQPHSTTPRRTSGTSFAAPAALSNYLLVNGFFKKNGIQKSADEIGKLTFANARKDLFYASGCGRGYGDMCFMDPFIKEILKKKQPQPIPPQKIEKNYTAPFKQDIFKKVGGYEWKRFQGNAQQIKNENGVLKVNFHSPNLWTSSELYIDPLQADMNTTLRIQAKNTIPVTLVVAEVVNKIIKGSIKTVLLQSTAQVKTTEVCFVRQKGISYVVRLIQQKVGPTGFLEVQSFDLFKNSNYEADFKKDVFTSNIEGYKWQRFQGNAQQVKSDGGVLKVNFHSPKMWTSSELYIDPLQADMNTTLRIQAKNTIPVTLVVAEVVNKIIKGSIKTVLLQSTAQVKTTEVCFVRQKGISYVVRLIQQKVGQTGFLELNSLTIE
jgi:hypothetical protein